MRFNDFDNYLDIPCFGYAYWVNPTEDCAPKALTITKILEYGMCYFYIVTAKVSSIVQ